MSVTRATPRPRGDNGPQNHDLSMALLGRLDSTRVELAHGLRIARAKLGKFGVRADLGKDFPRPRAFRPLRALEHHGDALHVVEAEGILRTLSEQQPRAAGNGNL